MKILTVNKTYKFEIGKFTFKSKNELLPVSVGNAFEISSVLLNHNHFVRNRQRNARVLCKTKIGEKSVQYSSFHLWKCIPTVIRDSESFNLFKKNYKIHLLSE